MRVDDFDHKNTTNVQIPNTMERHNRCRSIIEHSFSRRKETPPPFQKEEEVGPPVVVVRR